MARVIGNILNSFNPSLTLDRYQEIMHIPIAAFNGLNNPEEYVMDECSRIWTQSERNLLAQWMAVAEEMRERELGYHLAPKYVEDEEHSYGATILNNKHLIKVGKQAAEDISLGVTVAYRDGSNNILDPITLTIATTITDIDEIHVFYPGEDVQIHPTIITIDSGQAEIQIARSRLVKPALLDDRKDKLYYEDDANFLETVDVKRLYNSITTAVQFVWSASALAGYGITCLPGCTEQTQYGCAYITGERAKRISSISRLSPATFTGEEFTGTSFMHRCQPDNVRISYLSGVQSSPYQELLTARLSHTLMPSRPCACPVVEQYWMEDRKEAKFVSPYGATMGAQNAWMADSRAKIGIGGMWK